MMRDVMIIVMRMGVRIRVRMDMRARVDIVIVIRGRNSRTTVNIALICVECTAVVLKWSRLVLRRFRVMNLRRLYFQASVNQG